MAYEKTRLIEGVLDKEQVLLAPSGYEELLYPRSLSPKEIAFRNSVDLPKMVTSDDPLGNDLYALVYKAVWV